MRLASYELKTFMSACQTKSLYQTSVAMNINKKDVIAIFNDLEVRLGGALCQFNGDNIIFSYNAYQLEKELTPVYKKLIFLERLFNGELID